MGCNCKPQYDSCSSKEKECEKVEVHIHVDCCRDKCTCCKEQHTCQKKKCPQVKVMY